MLSAKRNPKGRRGRRYPKWLPLFFSIDLERSKHGFDVPICQVWLCCSHLPEGEKAHFSFKSEVQVTTFGAVLMCSHH